MVWCGGQQKAEFLTNDEINKMTCTFLSDLIKSSVTMTEHCFRMTVQPADVAKAKELFAANDEDADEDWAAEDETADDDDEKMEEGEDKDDDDALMYDGSDDEKETKNDNDDDDVYIDEEKYPQNNAHTPMFDAAYVATLIANE